MSLFLQLENIAKIKLRLATLRKSQIKLEESEKNTLVRRMYFCFRDEIYHVYVFVKHVPITRVYFKNADQSLIQKADEFANLTANIFESGPMPSP